MLENVVITTPRPLFQTALSDVYQGAYGSIRVAVKSLRMHATDVDKVTRVSGNWHTWAIRIQHIDGMIRTTGMRLPFGSTFVTKT